MSWLPGKGRTKGNRQEFLPEKLKRRKVMTTFGRVRQEGDCDFWPSGFPAPHGGPSRTDWDMVPVGISRPKGTQDLPNMRTGTIRLLQIKGRRQQLLHRR